MDLLHRHPLEVSLPPWAFAQLQAYRELQHQDVCKACSRDMLREHVVRTCELCGKRYEDQQTKSALVAT